MRSLFKFLSRFNTILLFLFFQSLCVYLISNHNHIHRSSFTRATGEVTGQVFTWNNGILEYLSLKQKNEQLAEENAALLMRIHGLKNNYYYEDGVVIDSLNQQQFHYKSAKIVHLTQTSKHNYITLNRGANHEIENDMGVITSQGLIGITSNVSANFSQVISLFNTDLFISAKIKTANHLGSIQWNGENRSFLQLNNVPRHVNVSKGDTIVTSGYSSLFPENHPIGIVHQVLEDPSGNFFHIDVTPSVVLEKVEYVLIVDYLLKEERLKLKKGE